MNNPNPNSNESFLPKYPPEKLGNYVFSRYIGQGSFGMVFKATEMTLNRDTAIKFPLLEWQKNTQILEHFKREAETVAKLKHKNIIPVYEAKFDPDVSFYIA